MMTTASKTILTLIVLVLVAGGGYFAWASSQENGNPLADLGQKKNYCKTDSADAGEMKWGVNALMFPFPVPAEDKTQPEVDEMWDKQISYLTDAGICYVRVGVPEWDFDHFERYLVKLKAANIEPILIVEDATGPAADGQEERHGYTYAKQVLQRFSKNVNYYQLANEVGGSAILGPQYPGTELSHYDSKRLKLTLDFVRGVSRAIAESDPTAKRILTINSLHIAILKEAIRTGVDYEITGYNWFSDFGLELENKVINEANGQTYPFLKELRALGKPIWVTELAAQADARTAVGQAEQGQFIRDAIAVAEAHDFEAVFPFTLIEDVKGLPGYGLLEVAESSTGEWKITGPRGGYTAYKNVIEERRKAQ